MGLLVGAAVAIKQVVALEGCLAFALLTFPALRRGVLPTRRFLGMAAAYAVGLFSLSLCYVVPTYVILGFAVAYTNMAATYPPVAPARIDGQLVGRLAMLSVGFLAFMYVFIRLFNTGG